MQCIQTDLPYIKEGMMDREKSREGELRSKIVFFFHSCVRPYNSAYILLVY